LFQFNLKKKLKKNENKKMNNISGNIIIFL